MNPHKEPARIDITAEIEETARDAEAWYNGNFTALELEKRVRKLKHKKAPGEDQIVAEHLEKCDQTMLLKLMNACLEQAEIPNAWRQATLKVLYKGKGKLTDPNNYRGIALLQTLFKLLTALLNQRIIRHIDHLLDDDQYGFRQGRSTIQAITKLLKAIKTALRKEKGKLYVVFVDFRKAFPSVDRAILIKKMNNIGIRGRFLKLIAATLRYNEIKVDDGLRATASIKQHEGLFEGDSLSPTAFLVFINDLGYSLDCDHTLFADDTVTYSEDIQTQQKALDGLDQWCAENKISVNLQKTKAIKFRKGGRMAKTDQLFFRGEKVEFVNEYRYTSV